ncbi:MAG: PulJ/GspJ family protein [Arcobacter sp.]
MNQFLKRTAHNKQGYTLLEIILVSVLGTLILLSALEIYLQVWNSTETNRKIFREVVELRKAIYWISHDLNRAKDVSTPSSDKLIINTANNTIIYVLDKKTLVRYEDGLKRTIAEGIMFVNFSIAEQKNGTMVTVQIKGQKKGVRTCVWIYAKN